MPDQPPSIDIIALQQRELNNNIEFRRLEFERGEKESRSLSRFEDTLMLGASEQDVHSSSGPYKDCWQYLADELRCLDLRLRLQVLAQTHARPADPLAPFRGLVITNTEISDLVAPPRTAAHEPAGGKPEKQELERALTQLEDEIALRRSASRRAGVTLSMPRLSELFGLTRFEEQCLIVCLAPEVDRKYTKLYAYLQDDVTRTGASIELVLRLLCSSPGEKVDARAAFDQASRLPKFMLLHISDGGNDSPPPLLSRVLKLDDRIVNFLIGRSPLDARLERVARIVVPRAGTLEALAAHGLYRRVSSFVQAYFADPQSARRNVVLYLHGPECLDKRLVVEAMCQESALPLLVADLEAMKADPLPFEQTAWLVAREAALRSAVLCLEGADCLVAEPEKHAVQLNSLIAAAKMFSRLTVMFGGGIGNPEASRKIACSCPLPGRGRIFRPARAFGNRA